MNNDKKIIWLASYPKSGNTMLRAFLSAYFFTHDGIFNNFSLLDNITSFHIMVKKYNPNISYDEYKNNLSLVAPQWIKAQEYFSSKIKSHLFLKTHNILGNVNNFPYTNEKLTKAFIYIIRDPRSVILSSSKYYNLTIEETLKHMTSLKRYSLGKTVPVPEIISSWSNNYKSWKFFSNKVPGCFVRYEDIILNPKKEYLSILNFLNKVFNFEINEKKLDNCIESINFKKLKKLEKNNSFKEKLDVKQPFFRKGKVYEWKSELPKKIRIEVENKFKLEMKELGYI